jgi:hypothetical protein
MEIHFQVAKETFILIGNCKMLIVAHRVNTIKELNQITTAYGIEIDIRADGSQLILNHEPFHGGERFIDYLEVYRHQLLVLNIKEAGIEAEVLKLVREKGIRDFFLLDVEFPYIHQSARKGERAIAIRYSEDESIEMALMYRGKVDWVWIDTNTKLPLDARVIQKLNGFKTCLVCPGRWGRSHDILVYRQRMQEFGFTPDAVMASPGNFSEWEKPIK